MTASQLKAKQLYQKAIDLLLNSNYTVISLGDIAAKMKISEPELKRSRTQLPKNSDLAEILDTEIENKLLENAINRDVSNQYIVDMYESEFNVKIEDMAPNDERPFKIIHLGRDPKL